jgi:hypothetical protein
MPADLTHDSPDAASTSKTGRVCGHGPGGPPSLLGDTQPDHWLAEYSCELINALNVLGLLRDLEPAQAELLERICAGPTITDEELRAAGAFEVLAEPKRKATKKADNLELFDDKT